VRVAGGVALKAALGLAVDGGWDALTALMHAERPRL
jgi:hypothetical protein